MKVAAFDLFMQQNRFDLIFKWLYLKNPDNAFVKKVYLEHIRAFNNFIELDPSDGVKKEGPEEFIKRFDELNNNIKNNGFLVQKGKIPIGLNGEINDGAHRLCCSAFYNLDVETNKDSQNYLFDYNFFKNNKMNPEYMDYGALEYVKLNQNAYIVNLHSISDINKDKQVVKILKKYGFIFYQKNIKLTFNGYVNLKKISYGSFWDKESWIGNVENKFAGAQAHARSCMGKYPLRVFVFVCDDLKKVIKAKSEIRELFGIGNYSVHINDCREEAIWLAETYFNSNSLFMINHRPFDFEDYEFDQRLLELGNKIKSKHIKKEDICCAGSSPLNVFGARKSDDLDFLYIKDTGFDLQTEFLSNHDSELKYYPYTKKEIICDEHNYFYYKGFKFISLDILFSMKKKRNEKPKDINDCKIIKNIKCKGKFLFNNHFKIFEKRKFGNQRKIILFGCITIRYTRKGRK